MKTIVIKPTLYGRLKLIKQLLFNKLVIIDENSKDWGKFGN